MQITKGPKIGTAIAKSAVKAYKKSPSDFNLAANAAAHYATKQNKSMLVIPGNSYGSKLFHIASADDSDLSRFTCGLGDKFMTVAIVESDGSVYRAELSKAIA
jgi:hypothetical protein